MENLEQIPNKIGHIIKEGGKIRRKIIKKAWTFVKQKFNWIISSEENEQQIRMHQSYKSQSENTIKMYNLNQKLQQQKQQTRQQIQKARQNADSPEQFRELNNKFQTYFIDFVKSLNLEPIIKDKKGKHYCFVGKTSVGKSSLYNALFDLHLQVGLGSCTKEVSIVKVIGNKTFWDVPGINNDFNMYTLDQLAFFNDLDQIFVLFDRDVDDVSFVIKILRALDKKVTFVRTKCDNITVNSKKTLEEQLERDKKQILQIYPKCEKVIGVGVGRYAQIKQLIQAQELKI